MYNKIEISKWFLTQDEKENIMNDISTCDKSVNNDIEMEVKQEGVTNRNSRQDAWKSDDNIELYFCYRLAKIQKLKVQQGT